MSSLTEEQPRTTKSPSLGKRVWEVLSIVMILLTPWVFYRDLKEAYKGGDDRKTFPGRLETAVSAQLAVLQQVDSGALGLTYFKTLQSNECNWLFECHPIHVPDPPNPISALVFDKPIVTLSPEVADAVEKGRQMALAPVPAKPPPASAPVTIPSSIKLHDMKGSAEPSDSTGSKLSSSFLQGASESSPVPGESEADRVRREKIAQIEKNLKAENPLSLPAGSSAGGLSSPANTATNPVANPSTFPTLPLTHVSSLSNGASFSTPPIEAVATAPAIFTKLGRIRLPTLHTIRGTPQALRRMIHAIHDAGIWAMAMYFLCTLIWITLWLRKMPFMLYLLIFGGPLSIPLMVTLMQWICEGLLKFGIAGCALAAGLMALLSSTALALLVGLHHAVKSPRELFEAVEHLKG